MTGGLSAKPFVGYTSLAVAALLVHCLKAYQTVSGALPVLAMNTSQGQIHVEMHKSCRRLNMALHVPIRYYKAKKSSPSESFWLSDANCLIRERTGTRPAAFLQATGPHANQFRTGQGHMARRAITCSSGTEIRNLRASVTNPLPTGWESCRK